MSENSHVEAQQSKLAALKSKVNRKVLIWSGVAAGITAVSAVALIKAKRSAPDLEDPNWNAEQRAQAEAIYEATLKATEN